MLQGPLPYTGQTEGELREQVMNGDMRFTCGDRELEWLEWLEWLVRRMLEREGSRKRMEELRRHRLFARGRLSSARSTSSTSMNRASA
jgi:hypothetical protein